MKRYGGLWDQIVSWPNLLLAARKARRGKRGREVVQRFDFHLERRLLELQQELQDGAYQPGPFTTHWISRPKPRLISAAPYRDRVVHHALMNVLEPILDRHFHPHSYACRKGKGTHAASRHLQQLLRRYRFALQCDIRKFFPSIDHAILKETFRRRLKDRRVLELLDRIVDGSNEQEAVTNWFAGDELLTPLTRRHGLPIGNLTSQWFANWYLDGFDQMLSSCWGIGGFVRYCDDFILLHDNRCLLRSLVPRLVACLAELRLKLHEERLRVIPATAGCCFVGYRTQPRRRRLTNQAMRRFLRRLTWLKRAFREGLITRDKVQQRLLSWLGHSGQADSLALLGRLARHWRCARGRFHSFVSRPI